MSMAAITGARVISSNRSRLEAWRAVVCETPHAVKGLADGNANAHPAGDHVLHRHSRAASRQPVLDRRRGAPVRGTPAPASGRISRRGRVPGSLGADARARTV